MELGTFTVSSPMTVTIGLSGLSLPRYPALPSPFRADSKHAAGRLAWHQGVPRVLFSEQRPEKLIGVNLKRQPTP